jgi:hypothetical protein
MRREHMAFQMEHAGHEEMHGEMMLILMVTMMLAQVSGGALGIAIFFRCLHDPCTNGVLFARPFPCNLQ